MAKPIDLLSIAGVTLAAAAVVGGQILEGGHLSSLANGPAFMIVAGGTVGAILVQAPLSVFKRALRRLAWIVAPPANLLEEARAKIVGWSQIARKEGLLGLENLIEQEPDTFFAKGLQLLVDGNEPEGIRHAMEMELTIREDAEFQAARVFESMGGYAPTIGIIGAVLGLIHVMENLAEPEKLGAGIAAAFVATVYGVGLANLLLLPVANKLKCVIYEQSRAKEMIIEGIIAIAHGENPRSIESRLRGFEPH